ncbi:hypothetical protein EC968_007643 [Mortierella alpina]|nr:hypothetical protein EC968_007643 [Mortierella alpina]
MALKLRQYLATNFPEYMVPVAFVGLHTFPLTSNGKLDRRALPRPSDADYALQTYDEPEGETEIILSVIWKELLNIEKVGRNDNFFLLGGHSLMAVRMFGRIRTMLGFDTTLRTLFEAPTIAELAPRLLAARASQEESYAVLLPIKPQGSHAPLFCVHPGNGLGWCFTGLSTQLDAEQPVYGLQARGFTGDGRLAATMDEMVQDYIDQVRRIQSQGPYRLLGYSFGGVVAVAMASCLEEQGERVALLAVMDSRADYHSREHGEGENEDAEEAVVKELVVGNLDKQSTDVNMDWTSRIKRNIRRIGRTEAPRVFKGDLLILRATIPSKAIVSWKLLNPEDWKPYILGKIEVHDVESMHEHMHMPEPTVVIGRVLCQKLNELQGP